jgi:uncharacterized membrane protein
MPPSSSSYDLVWNYLVPVALPLLLFRANIVEIVRTSRSMFLAFHCSALGTLLGAALAVVVVNYVIMHFPASAATLPDVEQNLPKMAGVMTGSYTGGAVNFFAVKASLDVDENLVNPLFIADNFIMAGMFAVLLILAGGTRPRELRQEADEPASVAAASQSADGQPDQRPITPRDLALALAIATAIAAVSHKLAALVDPAVTDVAWLQQVLGNDLVRAILGNPYFLIAVLSMSAATLFPRTLSGIRGADELGVFLLYAFFFVIGLPADLLTVLAEVPLMFLFCLVISLTNLACTLGLGRLLRLERAELLLCVNATLGGPATAAAMAVTKGWSHLVLPSLLVGIWGYVIGTFLGVLVAQFAGRLM